MEETTIQNEASRISEKTQYENKDDDENCFCEKKQCMLGLASIAIGIGGLGIAILI